MNSEYPNVSMSAEQRRLWARKQRGERLTKKERKILAGKNPRPAKPDMRFSDLNAKRKAFSKQFLLQLPQNLFEKGMKSLIKQHAKFYGLNNKYNGDGSRRC